MIEEIVQYVDRKQVSIVMYSWQMVAADIEILKKLKFVEFETISDQL